VVLLAAIGDDKAVVSGDMSSRAPNAAACYKAARTSPWVTPAAGWSVTPLCEFVHPIRSLIHPI
jgi:hypothetical protein